MSGLEVLIEALDMDPRHFIQSTNADRSLWDHLLLSQNFVSKCSSPPATLLVTSCELAHPLIPSPCVFRSCSHRVTSSLCVLASTPSLHLRFKCGRALFTGDMLFTAGCGMFFEGDADTVLRTFNRVRDLPLDTLLYPGHEYSLPNLLFAREVEPENQALLEMLRWASHRRHLGLGTVPTTLKQELEFNPFLRGTKAAGKHRVCTCFCCVSGFWRPSQPNSSLSRLFGCIFFFLMSPVVGFRRAFRTTPQCEGASSSYVARIRDW